jgi:hypothetical protein
MARALDAGEYTCTRIFEAQAERRGCRLIAGCDEAGRGALLGPLYAAAVILDPAKPIPGVDDSKKLSAEVRAELAPEIRAKAIAFQVVAIAAAQVDALNVYQASRRGIPPATMRLDFPSPTGRSSTVMRDRYPSPPLPSWPRFRATRAWKNLTAFILNTSSPGTRATARPIILLLWLVTGRAPSIAVLSSPSRITCFRYSHSRGIPDRGSCSQCRTSNVTLVCYTRCRISRGLKS